jgi:hypothetical protein
VKTPPGLARKNLGKFILTRSDKGKKHAPYDGRLRSMRAQLRRLANPKEPKTPKRKRLEGKARLAVIPPDRICPACHCEVSHSRAAWVCFWVTGAARGFAICKSCWTAFGQLSELKELRREFESNDQFDIRFVACDEWRDTMEPSKLCRQCLGCALRRCRKL